MQTAPPPGCPPTRTSRFAALDHNAVRAGDRRLALRVACLALLAGNAAASCPPGPGPELDAIRARYGAVPLTFEVLRNGRKVGEHHVRFADAAGALQVTSDMSLSLRVLFMEAYHFRYHALETWCAGQLVQLEVHTDDNGHHTRLKAALAEGRLRVDNGQGTVTAIAPMFPTSHWHSGVLGARAVLNTLTGHVNQVTLEACEAPAPGATSPGTCHDYRGDLTARVWYDTEGRWRGLAFAGKDGSSIEYRPAVSAADPRPL